MTPPFRLNFWLLISAIQRFPSPDSALVCGWHYRPSPRSESRFASAFDALPFTRVKILIFFPEIEELRIQTPGGKRSLEGIPGNREIRD